MRPDKNELDRLFRQFMEGTCTPSESQMLWQWFFLLDVRSKEMMQDKQREAVAREAMRDVIMAEVRPARPRLRFLRWQAVAAAVLAAVVCIGLFLQRSLPDRKDSLATVFVNDSATVISLYLPDSSRVVLSRSSRLSWSADFNTRERRVSLTGEGYFEIRPDRLHPFIVESNGMETKALGTAFVIEAYEAESEMRVSLLQGKVAVTAPHNMYRPALLTPGQLLRYHYRQKDFRIELITVSDPLAWTKGGMTFNNVPLTEAIDRLARRHALVIHYDPARLKGKMVSGSFHAASWDKLLQGILFIHDLHYSMQDSTIQIIPIP